MANVAHFYDELQLQRVPSSCGSKPPRVRKRLIDELQETAPPRLGAPVALPPVPTYDEFVRGQISTVARVPPTWRTMPPLTAKPVAHALSTAASAGAWLAGAVAQASQQAEAWCAKWAADLAEYVRLYGGA